MLKLSLFTSILIAIISIIIIVSCAYFKSIKEGLTNNVLFDKLKKYNTTNLL
jgi:hypothetical protein